MCKIWRQTVGRLIPVFNETKRNVDRRRWRLIMIDHFNSLSLSLSVSGSARSGEPLTHPNSNSNSTRAEAQRTRTSAFRFFFAHLKKPSLGEEKAIHRPIGGGVGVGYDGQLAVSVKSIFIDDVVVVVTA